MKALGPLIFAVLLCVAVPLFAEEDPFDGTKPLLCASVEAIDCDPGETCERGIPEMMGAPQFLRIDFAKKEIIGPRRTAKILIVEKNDEQITLQGYEIGLGWTIAIERGTGKITTTFAGADTAFIVFGACTPLYAAALACARSAYER